jgi:hypothetical protein
MNHRKFSFSFHDNQVGIYCGVVCSEDTRVSPRRRSNQRSLLFFTAPSKEGSFVKLGVVTRHPTARSDSGAIRENGMCISSLGRPGFQQQLSIDSSTTVITEAIPIIFTLRISILPPVE